MCVNKDTELYRDMKVFWDTLASLSEQSDQTRAEKKEWTDRTDNCKIKINGPTTYCFTCGMHNVL